VTTSRTEATEMPVRRDGGRQFPSSPTEFYLGVHGVLTLHPWLAEVPEDDLEEDGHSLVMKRAEALGLADFDPHSPEPVRWLHSDAGGDWTQDGTVRQVAWLQGYAVDVPQQRMPLHPAFGVLGDVIRRLGQVELRAVHGLVPLTLGHRSIMRLVTMMDWYEMADPGSATDLRISVRTDTGRTGLGEAIREEIDRDRRRECLQLGPAERGADPGLPHMEGEEILQDATNSEVLAGRGRTWSLDFAAWALETVADACRAVGEDGHAFVTVEKRSSVPFAPRRPSIPASGTD
jgi:hypothetical protein